MQNDSNGQIEQPNEQRRKALQKIAMLGAYSTPVVLGVLAPRKALSASDHRPCFFPE